MSFKLAVSPAALPAEETVAFPYELRVADGAVDSEALLADKISAVVNQSSPTPAFFADQKVILHLPDHNSPPKTELVISHIGTFPIYCTDVRLSSKKIRKSLTESVSSSRDRDAGINSPRYGEKRQRTVLSGVSSRQRPSGGNT